MLRNLAESRGLSSHNNWTALSRWRQKAVSLEKDLLLFCIHLRKNASAHRLKCRNKNGNLAKSCTDKEKGTVRDADQCPVRRASDITAVNGWSKKVCIVFSTFSRLTAFEAIFRQKMKKQEALYESRRMELSRSEAAECRPVFRVAALKWWFIRKNIWKKLI